MKILVTDRNGDEHEVEATVGEPLMFALRAQDLVDATCSGSCSCATCHLYIEQEWLEKLAPPSEDEEEVIEFLNFGSENSRLSCQLTASEDLDGMRVTVAPEEGF